MEHVQTQAREVVVDVVHFEEERALRTVPLWDIHEEFFVAPVLGSRHEVKVVVVDRAANLHVFVDVVGEIERRGARIKFSVGHFADRRFEVVVVFRRGVQTVFPTVDGTVDAGGDVLAGSGRIHAGRDFTLHGARAALLRDDVDGAADRVGAVEHGGRPLDDFDAFDHGRIDQDGRARHRLVFGNLLAVDHDERAEGVFAADLHAVDALTAVVLDFHARDVGEEVPDGLGAGLFNVLARDHRDGHRNFHEFLFDTGGGHVNGFGLENVFGRDGAGGKSEGDGCGEAADGVRSLHVCLEG